VTVALTLASALLTTTGAAILAWETYVYISIIAFFCWLATVITSY